MASLPSPAHGPGICAPRGKTELNVPLAHSHQRLLSLDVFRGFTIAAMVLVNNPGSWSAIYPPLAHAKWNGWTFTDWIFPFFLFISGVSMTLSTQRALAAGSSQRTVLFGLWRRAMVIVAIGLLLNFIPSFSLATLRYPGVLQRIGLCVALAAPVVVWGRTGAQTLLAMVCLVLYSALMLGATVPDVNGVLVTGVLEPGRDTGAYVDRWLMGAHLWAGSRTWDPEGLVSTLGAVASLLAGTLTGRWLQGCAAPAAKSAWLFVAGLLALWLGVVLDAVFMPINKSLWTPSYAVFMSGWALLLLGVSHWLLDACDSPVVRQRSAFWSRPLAIYGVNALFIFVLSGLVARLLGVVTLAADDAAVTLKSWLYAQLTQLPIIPLNASLLFAVLFNLAMWAVAWLLWRQRIFIKV